MRRLATLPVLAVLCLPAAACGTTSGSHSLNLANRESLERYPAQFPALTLDELDRLRSRPARVPFTLAIAPLRYRFDYSDGPVMESTRSDDADPTADGDLREILDVNHGYDFPLPNEEMQLELARLLGDDFGIFESAVVLRGNPTDLPAELLCQRAAAERADLLMVVTVRRNRISYMGANFMCLVSFCTGAFGVGPHLWVPDEEFRCDLELVVEIYETRFGTRVFDETYRTWYQQALNDFERGWKVCSHLWYAFPDWFFGLLEENFVLAGEVVRPPALAELERRLLEDLHGPFAGRARAPSFPRPRGRPL